MIYLCALCWIVASVGLGYLMGTAIADECDWERYEHYADEGFAPGKRGNE